MYYGALTLNFDYVKYNAEAAKANLRRNPPTSFHERNRGPSQRSARVPSSFRTTRIDIRSHLKMESKNHFTSELSSTTDSFPPLLHSCNGSTISYDNATQTALSALLPPPLAFFDFGFFGGSDRFPPPPSTLNLKTVKSYDGLKKGIAI